jgi:large subunit ribosomal protein L29
MIGSKNLTPADLDKIEDSLLVEELKKAKEELFNLRFQSATGQLDNHGRMRAVKRDIARINTVLRERELGIRAVPVATPAAAAPTKTKKAAVAAEATESAAADSAEKPAKEN